MTHPHPLVRTHVLAPGWRLEPDDPLPDGRDVGPNGEPGWALDWYVLGPGGASASLAWAAETGTCSDDAETPLPPRAVAAVEALYRKLTDAQLY